MRTEHEGCRRQRVSEHGVWCDDRDAGELGGGRSRSAVDDVGRIVGAAPLVITRSTDRKIRYRNRIDEHAVVTRMPDAYLPSRTVRPSSCNEQVASCIDGEIVKRRQLACRHVDRESLGDRTEVQHQRTTQCDGST